MKQITLYVTEDGRQFEKFEDALEHEDYLNRNLVDLSFKHLYTVGDRVWLVSKGFLWDCVFVREDYYVFEDYTDYQGRLSFPGTTYAKVRLNNLVFRSLTDPEEEFKLTNPDQLESVSKNITDLIKTTIPFHVGNMND